jgi:hypothetical protein
MVISAIIRGMRTTSQIKRNYANINTRKATTPSAKVTYLLRAKAARNDPRAIATTNSKAFILVSFRFTYIRSKITKVT